MPSLKFSKINSGPLLILTASSLWALDGVIRRSLYILPPLVIIFYEHLMGFSFWILMGLRHGYRISRVKKILSSIPVKAWGWAMMVAIVSGLLGTLMFTTALQKVEYIDFSVVLLLQKLQPIFAVMAAKVLLKEKLSSHYLRWAIIALVAAYFVTFPMGIVNFNTGVGTLMAGLLAVGAAVAWGSSTAFSKILIKQVGANLATGLRFGLTTIVSGLVMLVWSDSILSSALSVTFDQVWRFGLIALSTGMVALWLYYRGLAKTEAKVSTILELWFPVLAIATGAVMYGQWLDPTQLIAALIMVLAIKQVAKS